MDAPIEEARNTPSFECSEVVKREEKVVEIPQRLLIPGQPGFEVQFHHIDNRGVFWLAYVDSYAKITRKRLIDDLEKFYGVRNGRGLYGVDFGTLEVGEIVIARVCLRDGKKRIFMRGRILTLDHSKKSAFVEDMDSVSRHHVIQTRLFRIIGHFASEPARVVKCKLLNLEIISGTPVAHKVALMCPVPKPLLYIMEFSGSYAKEDNIPLVILHKIDAYNFSDMYLGVHILKNLSCAISPLISLEERKGNGLCKITHCISGGILWLRFLSDDWIWKRTNVEIQKYSRLLKTSMANDSLDEEVIKKSLNTGKDIVYATEFTNMKTGKKSIRRAVVTKLLEDENVSVRYIDYGENGTVSLSQIIPIEVCSTALAFIPPLVVQVHLEGINSTTINMELLKEIIPGNSVVAKVVDEWPGNVHPPEVRILLEEQNCDSDIDRSELEQKDDDYLNEPNIRFTPKTLSGVLLKKKLAEPISENQRKTINVAKLQLSRKLAARAAPHKYDEIERTSRRKIR